MTRAAAGIASTEAEHLIYYGPRWQHPERCEVPRPPMLAAPQNM